MRRLALLSYEDREFSVPLFDESIASDGASVTVIIGPNGCGKSRVLGRLVDELCAIDAARSSRPPLHGSRTAGSDAAATLRYRVDDAVCRIVRRGREFDCSIDGEAVALPRMPFPGRVATVSHLPSDKFQFARGDTSGFYRYLGLRQATNLTTTGALETKVVQSLMLGFAQDASFPLRLQRWLALVGLSEPRVSILLAHPDLFSADWDEFRVAASTAAARSLGQLRRESLDKDPAWPNDLDLVWSAVSALREIAVRDAGHRPNAAFDLRDLGVEPDRARMVVSGMDVARRRRLFRSISLQLTKAGTRLSFSALSSGEQQLIGTNARLLSELAPDSIVVVDEPEISLHPEWQIRYVPTLRESLSDLAGTHAILATHSHFMVSDLSKDDSALVVAEGSSPATFSLFGGEVHGRSPENILYRVFGVASAGNFYVERDLERGLAMISDPRLLDRSELGGILARLQRFRGKDNPAFNLILHEMSAAMTAP